MASTVVEAVSLGSTDMSSQGQVVIKATNSSFTVNQPTVSPDSYTSPLKNIIDTTRVDLNHFDHKRFVTTKASKDLLERLNDHGLVVLVGRSRQGKTTLAMHALKHLSRNRQTKPVQLCDPNDWWLLPHEFGRQKFVVFVDDMFGFKTINETLMERWMKLFEMIWPLIECGNFKLIVSITSDIYEKCKQGISRFHIFKNGHILSMEDERYRLTKEETMKMATASMKQSSDDLLAMNMSITKVIPFPRLCQVYESNKRIQERGLDFFRNPVEVMLPDINSMKEYSQLTYVILVLIMFMKGELPRTFFCKHGYSWSPYSLDILKSIRRFISFSFEENVMDFQMAADRMIGKYLSFTNNVYRFIHPVVHDSLLLSFPEFYLKDIIDICPARFLLQYIQLQTCELSEASLALQVSTDSCKYLAERIACELVIGDYQTVLCHPALEDKQFVRVLTDILKEEGCKAIMRRNIGFIHFFQHELSWSQAVCRFSSGKISIDWPHKTKTYLFNYKTILCHIMVRNLTVLANSIISQIPNHYDRRLLKCICFSGLGKSVLVACLKEHQYGNFRFLGTLLNLCITSPRDNRQPLDTVLRRMWTLADEEKKTSLFNYEIKISARLAVGRNKLTQLRTLMPYLRQSYTFDTFLVQLLSMHIPNPFESGLTSDRHGLFRDVKFTKMLKVLLDQGPTGDPGVLLSLAALHPTAEALSVLLNKWPDAPGINNIMGIEIAERLVGLTFLIHSSKASTPLLEASKKNIDSVRLLLEHGADVNIVDDAGYSILHSSLIYTHVDTLREIISKTTSVHSTILWESATPLHIASRHGNIECFLTMLLTFSDVNQQDAYGLTALHHAVRSDIDRREKCESLLAAGANINARDGKGDTILHGAVIASNANLVITLIELGANVNEANEAGHSPLHKALSSDLSKQYAKECVQALVENGADILQSNCHRLTLISLAIEKGSVEILNLLLDHCRIQVCQEDVSKIYSNPLSASRVELESLIEHGLCPTADVATMYLGKLVESKFNGEYFTYHVDYFKHQAHLLLDKGADTSKLTTSGETPLQIALKNQYSMFWRDDSQMIYYSALLTWPIDIFQTFAEEVGIPTGEDAVSFLEGAARIRYWKCLALMMEKNFDPTTTFSECNTLVHLYCHSWKCLNVLLKHGVDLNTQNISGSTALHVLANAGKNAGHVSLLLKHGADPNIKDNGGDTPVLVACRRAVHAWELVKQEKKAMINVLEEADIKRKPNGSVEFTRRYIRKDLGVHRYTVKCVSTLLANGADGSIKDAKGNAPVHIAVKQQNYDLLRALLRGGCSTNVTDNADNTPLHLLLKQTRLEQGDIDEEFRDIQRNSDQKKPRFSNYKGVAVQTDPHDQGCTPVQFGQTGMWILVKELLNYKADPNKENKAGETALHVATSLNCLRTVELLLEADADLDVKDADGRTPLHRLAHVGCTNIARVLLDKDRDIIDVTDVNGDTALHVAVRSKKYNLVKLMSQKGADLTLLNNDRKTACDLCAELEEGSSQGWWRHKGLRMMALLHAKE